MENLSAAQFNMIRRGTDAAVQQTRPILGTIKKVAEGVGYQLGRKTQVNDHHDADGNFLHRDITSSQGFRSLTKRFNADGSSQVTNMSRQGLPGLFDGRTNTTSSFRPRRTPRTGQTGQPPSPGPSAPPVPGAVGPHMPWSPPGSNLPSSTTYGGWSGVTTNSPFGQPGPALGEQALLNETTGRGDQRRQWARDQRQRNRQQPLSPTVPQDISSFNQPSSSPFRGDNSPTQPLPFNGSPQGRSDYGNPFGTP